jgi:RNA polymerase sigma-70 factor (ECF subfamily)
MAVGSGESSWLNRDADVDFWREASLNWIRDTGASRWIHRLVGGYVNPQTDVDTIRLVLEGDKDCYALLVNAYSERVINYLVRMTGDRCEAEDLAQEAFVRAYFALRSYDPQYKFSTWIFKIATNLCINHLKKRRRLVHVDDYLDEDGKSIWVLPDTHSYGNPTRAVDRQELQKQIQQALDQIPAVYRSIVILRHVHGLSYQEIADVTGLPIGTIKSRLGRGRHRLIALLKGKM